MNEIDEKRYKNEYKAINQLQEVITKTETLSNQGEVVKIGFWEKVKMSTTIFETLTKVMSDDTRNGIKSIIKKLLEIAQGFDLPGL